MNGESPGGTVPTGSAATDASFGWLDEVGVSSGHVDGPDGALHFTRTGAGHPLVLLHPLALSGEIWGEFGARLAMGFDVIALDARGHGRSAWSGAPFTIEDLALDVRSVLDALNIPRAHVVGMSMGGSTALAVATEAPDRVSGLFLADTTAWYGPDAQPTWGQRADRTLADPRDRQIPFQLDRWFTRSFRDSRPDVVNAVAKVFLTTDSAAHAAACRALGGMDLRDALDVITAPTLVIAGDEDYATPPDMAAAIAELIPDAHAAVIAGVRHLSLVERPDLADEAAVHLHGIEAAA